MLMWYFVDGVWILKFSVSPTLTLIEVAKPWIDSSPMPLICHWFGGTPGFEFSQTIGLVTGTAHGPVSAAAASGAPPPAVVKKRNATARVTTNSGAMPRRARRGMRG